MSSHATSPVSRSVRRAAVGLSATLGALASLSTVTIMVATTTDVLFRNIAGRSLPGLLELSQSALVATVFFGLAYAGATNAHVAVDLLTSRFPTGFSRRLAGVMWVVGGAMVVWLLVATIERAIQSTASGEITTGLMNWPIWPARWFIVVGYLTFLFVAAVNAYLSFRNEPLLGEENESLPGEEVQPAHGDKKERAINQREEEG